MAIDLGDDPGGTPPTTAEKLQIRSAIGVGTTDAPAFAGLSTTGNAGIGTATPASGLHVSGALGTNVITYDSAAALKLTNTSGGSWLVTSGVIGVANAHFSIRQESVSQPAIVVTGTGNNVGIGINAPVAKLDILDTALSGSGSLAGSALNIAQTWNTTGTPTAIKLNVVETGINSNAASNLMDLQVGGVSKVSVRKDGNLKVLGSAGVHSTSYLTNDGTSGNTDWGTYLRNDQGLALKSTNALSWTSGAATLTRTLLLEQDAAGILAQRNLTNPQAFRVANSVGASPLVDYDRGVFDFKTTTNTLRIGTENGGTYTLARPIEFVTGGVVRMSIETSNNVVFQGAITTATSNQGIIRCANNSIVAASNDGTIRALRLRGDAGGALAWASGGDPTGGLSAAIMQISSGVLAIGNGTVNSFAGSIKLTNIEAVGDIEIGTVTSGIILKAAGTSTRYRLTLNAGGTALVFTAV